MHIVKIRDIKTGGMVSVNRATARAWVLAGKGQYLDDDGYQGRYLRRDMEAAEDRKPRQVRAKKIAAK